MKFNVLYVGGFIVLLNIFFLGEKDGRVALEYIALVVSDVMCIFVNDGGCNDNTAIKMM